jgi:hypothetical protein
MKLMYGTIPRYKNFYVCVSGWAGAIQNMKYARTHTRKHRTVEEQLASVSHDKNMVSWQRPHHHRVSHCEHNYSAPIPVAIHLSFHEMVI